MPNFLKCEGSLLVKLKLDLLYEIRGNVTHKIIEVDNDTPYKISYVDSEGGYKTINGRITSCTMSNKKVIRDYVSADTTKISFGDVDTITVDCSSLGQSEIYHIGIYDIRSVEELVTEGFEEISNKPKDITTFN